MKVALVHDALVNQGGAEFVFQVFCEMFPNANIYTSIYLEEKTYPFFKNRNIITTPLQKLLTTESHLKSLFPLANLFMKHLKIEDCDIILNSSTFSGKYIDKKNSKHVCYCYTPFRLLWHTDSYERYRKNKFKISFIKPFLFPFRQWDYVVAQKIDKFITMTNETSLRIKNAYNKESEIVPPPIDISRFSFGKSNGVYFLVVSRLEPYKKVDLVIEVFNKIKLPLKIVGRGTLGEKLKQLAHSNIEFLDNVTNNELIKLYQNCIAVIFPQKEDYGLVPIEANACGKPVICYGYGGVEKTMIPYSTVNANLSTALFFYEQSEKALIEAIKNFDKINFNKEALKNNALRFDKDIFKDRIYKIIENV